MSTIGTKTSKPRAKASGKENAGPSAYDRNKKILADSDRQGGEFVSKRRLSLTSEDAAKTGPAEFPTKKSRFHIHCDHRKTTFEPKIPDGRFGVASSQRQSRVDTKRRTACVASKKNKDDGLDVKFQNREEAKNLNSHRVKTSSTLTVGSGAKPKSGSHRRSSSLTTNKSQNATSKKTLSVCKLTTRSASATRALSPRSSLHPKKWIFSSKSDSLPKIGNALSNLPSQGKKQRVPENPLESGSIATHKETGMNVERESSTANLKKSGIRTRLPVVVNRSISRLINHQSCSTRTPIDTVPPEAPLLPKAMRLKTDRKENVDPIQILMLNHPQEMDSISAPFVLHKDYHEDIPKTELEREALAPYLSEEFLSKNMNAEQRKLVVSFLLHLGTHCNYQSSIIHHSVKLFDVAMDRLEVETKTIQLTALAALWIALKSHINTSKIPSATTILALAKGLYLGMEKLLLDYERTIMKALKFNLTFVDTFTLFSYHLLNCNKHLKLSDEKIVFLYNCGGYMLDLTLLHEDFCRISPSLIAFTVAELTLGLGIDVIQKDVKPRWTLWRLLITNGSPYYSTLCKDEIAHIRIEILRCAKRSIHAHSASNVVYRKYKRSKYGKISKSLFSRLENISMDEILDL